MDGPLLNNLKLRQDNKKIGENLNHHIVEPLWAVECIYKKNKYGTAQNKSKIKEWVNGEEAMPV